MNNICANCGHVKSSHHFINGKCWSFCPCTSFHPSEDKSAPEKKETYTPQPVIDRLYPLSPRKENEKSSNPPEPKEQSEALDEITELTERIVIEYANLSGRDSENRAIFRQRVEKIIRTQFPKYAAKMVEAAMQGMEPRKNHFMCYSVGDLEAARKEVRHNLGCICINLAPASVHFKDCPLGNKLVSFEKAKSDGIQAEKLRILKVIDDYFAGLIMIPDPQATKENLKKFIQAPHEEEKV